MVSDFPDDDNGNVLRRMLRGGDDFAKPRDIDFSIVFPSDSAAKEFGNHFVQLGFKVSVEKSNCEPELPWDVTVTKYMLPTHAGITEFEETLEAVAARFGGRNDGWGCFRQSVQH